MNGLDRRRILVGGAALATASAAVLAEPRRQAGVLAPGALTKLIPLQVGIRRGVDDLDVVPESVDATPVSGQTVTRRYLGGSGPPLMVVVSYHGSRSPELKVHRPETCYRVAGFSVDALKPIIVPLVGKMIPAVAFASRRGEREELVLYWTRVGASFPQTLTDQRLAFVKQALSGFRADGLLARISIAGSRQDLDSGALVTFAKDLLLAASPIARHLLIGTQAAAIS